MLKKLNRDGLLKHKIVFGALTGIFAVATAISIFSLIPQNNQPIKKASASNNMLSATCSASTPEQCFSKRLSESDGFGSVDFLFLPNQGATAPIFSNTTASATVTLELKNFSVADDPTLAQTYQCTYAGVKEFATADVSTSYRDLDRETPVSGTVNYSPSTGCGVYQFTYQDRLDLGGSIGLNYEFKVQLTRVSDGKTFNFRDSYIYAIGGGGTAN